MEMGSVLDNNSIFVDRSCVHEFIANTCLRWWDVMFTLYEIITRRRPSDKFLEYAQMVGMVLLLG
jgi:hypothetical protein